MKRRNLPFSLILIFIVLGGFTFSFFSFVDEPEYSPRNPKDQILKRPAKPATEFLKQIRNNQITGLIESADLKLQQQELEILGNSRAVDLEWKQMGPDNFAGRTRAVLFTENNNTITTYIGSVSGGIWKSTNLGTTWNKVHSGNENLFVTCLAKTSDGTIYAGTGETYDAQKVSGLDDMNYTSGFMGQGIFKSTDGENFTLIESTKPQYNNTDSDWAFINELAVNSGNNRIYASTNSGLRYSNDGGTTWAVAKDTDGNELSQFSWDVQVGSDGNVIACVDNMAYVSTSGDPNAFVMRSVGDSVSLPEASMVKRIEFAIAPSDANVVYASVVNNTGNVYNIYKSTNQGIDWRVVMPGTTTLNVFNDQGVYNNTITVFPDNPDNLLLGGIDMWQGRKITEEGFFDWRSISESVSMPLFPSYVHEDHHKYVFLPGSATQFMAATDGGVFLGNLQSGNFTYETSNRNYYTTQFYAVGPSGIKNYVLGGSQDNGTITIPPTGGNTDDAGFQVLTGEGGPCAISLINPEVIVVTSTGGTILRSDDGGENYSNPGQFPGSVIMVPAFRTPIALQENFNNTNSLYEIYYFAMDTLPGGSNVFVRSHNSGQPFRYTTPNDVVMYPGDSILVQDVVTANLYMSAKDKVWLTLDLHQFAKETEWFNISSKDYNGVSGTPYSMAYSADGNHLFVGTLDGKLFRISNLVMAQTFEMADVTSPGCIISTQEIELMVPGTDTEVSQVVTSISVDPKNPNNVMITLGNYGNENYVMYSENALTQFPEFKSRQGNLPHMPVYSSVIEMSDNKIAILGTEHGIFMTENIMAASPQWVSASSDMGSVPVFDLKQQIVDQEKITLTFENGGEITYITYPGTDNWGSIYAGTYGRAIFRNDDFYRVGIDDIYADETKKLQLKLYPNPIKTFTNVELEVETSTEVEFMVNDLNGRLVHSQSNTLNKGNNKIHIELGNLPTGTYVMRALSGNKVYSQKFIVN